MQISSNIAISNELKKILVGVHQLCWCMHWHSQCNPRKADSSSLWHKLFRFVFC